MLLKIDIQRSWSIALWLVLLHVGASIVIVSLAITIVFKLIVITVCCINAVYLFRQHVIHHNAKSIVRIQQLTDQQWLLLQHDGTQLTGHLTQTSIVTYYLVILYFRIKQRKRSLAILLCSDNVDRQQLRQLRIKLLQGINIVS